MTVLSGRFLISNKIIIELNFTTSQLVGAQSMLIHSYVVTRKKTTVPSLANYMDWVNQSAGKAILVQIQLIDRKIPSKIPWRPRV